MERSGGGPCFDFSCLVEDLPPDAGQFSSQLHDNAIGGPNSYQTGLFAGRTIRAELMEVQKANVARKYGLKDRRPLDPPPCVQMRLFEILHLGTPEQSEQEFVDYTAASLGMMCQVDLFPVSDKGAAAMPDPSAEELSNPPQIFVEDVDQLTDRDSPAPSSSAIATPSSLGLVPFTISQEAFTPNSFRSLSYSSSFGLVPSNTDINIPFSSNPPLGSDRFSFMRDTDVGMAGPFSIAQHSHTTSMNFLPEPAMSGDQTVPATSEDSKLTSALYGTLVAHGTPVDHEGKQVVMFVFSDLSVRTVGTYRLRYRAFHIQSGSAVNGSTPVIAECMGGPFTVYSTKGFPGLQASTDLSKRLSMYGVKVVTREQARTRRKLGDA